MRFTSRRWLRYLVGPIVLDLWLVGLLALLLAGMTAIPWTVGQPIRIALAAVFVLFAPGYAFVSVLFPEARGDVSGSEEPTARDPGAGARTAPTDTDSDNHDSVPNDSAIRHGRGIDGIERLVFGFGLSVALTALIALSLNFTPWGIRLRPLVIALAGFTVVNLIVAGYRRSRLLRRSDLARPISTKQLRIDSGAYVPPFDRLPRLASELRDDLLGRNADSRLEQALTVALVISILFSAASVGWALSTPRPGAKYTEFYLLTQDDDGELVAGHYPTNLTVDTPTPVVVSIHNHEFDTVTYTVEIRLRDPETGRSSAMETVRGIRLEHNATWQRTLALAPPFPGTDLRIEFYLFRDTAEDRTPYRRLHLIVDVSISG